jgi:hypothetical protein
VVDFFIQVSSVGTTLVVMKPREWAPGNYALVSAWTDYKLHRPTKSSYFNYGKP